MTTEANKFKVGIFLIAGFLIFNGGLIWIGAARLFERTAPYVTYFGESVQGLDVGSAVKFRGVPLGRVTQIRVAPDGALVEVRMEIAPDFRVSPGMRAFLATSGITGITFVEIGFLREGVVPTAPQLSFKPRGEYIPSQRSFLTNLMTTLNDIANQLSSTGVQGLVADVRDLANMAKGKIAGPEIDRALQSIAQAAAALDALTRRMNTFAEDPRLSGTLQRVGAAVEDLESSARSAKTLLADPRLTQSLEDLRAAAVGLRRFSEEINKEAAALRAGERLDSLGRQFDGALGGVDAAAARWERTAAATEHSLQDALIRIGRAAGRLENLSRSLEASPSRLLLEKPAREDFR